MAGETVPVHVGTSMAGLKVLVVTPQGLAVDQQADMVVAPTVMGEVAILWNHRSLLTELVAGQALLVAGGKAQRWAVSGGFLEVDDNQVVLLAETAERAGEIDMERARRALTGAERRLKSMNAFMPEYETELARAERARARLLVGSAGAGGAST